MTTSLYPDGHLEVDEGGGEDLEGRHASAVGRLHQGLPGENPNDQRSRIREEEIKRINH